MADSTSFYFAIFRKLQCAAGISYSGGEAHFQVDNPPPPATSDVSASFSLRTVGDMWGIVQMNGLGPGAGGYNYLPPNTTNFMQGSYPLPPGVTDRNQCPLWLMLNQSLMVDNVPMTISPPPPNNMQVWPTMPMPVPTNAQGTLGSTAGYTDWLSFNPKTGTRLIDKFGDWIGAGKPDDSPKAPLDFDSLNAAPLAEFPLATTFEPVLFVASSPADTGRRPGDGSNLPAQDNPVPLDFWNTAQIFLTELTGELPQPPLTQLDMGSQYYAVAVIGNAGNKGAGRVMNAGAAPNTPALPQILATAQAIVFGTGHSPSVPLVALSNLDPTDTNPNYEQYFLKYNSRDVVGFRFDTSTVFGQLELKLQHETSWDASMAQTWLLQGHVCLIVQIIQGEVGNPFPASTKGNPLFDRHIAQRNIAPFSLTMVAPKVPHWIRFMIAQVGLGANVLAPQHDWPIDTLEVYVAIAEPDYAAYVAKDGGVRGFEVVREPLPGPGPFPAAFPRAVILRQTAPEARLTVAEHGRQRLLGLAIGVAGDPARLAGRTPGPLNMVHTTADGGIAGGFTVQPVMAG